MKKLSATARTKKNKKKNKVVLLNKAEMRNCKTVLSKHEFSKRCRNYLKAVSRGVHMGPHVATFLQCKFH